MSPDGSWRLRRRLDVERPLIRRALLAFSVAVAAALAGQAATAQGPFPKLAVTTLSSAKLTLPDDLPATSCVLIVGFTKASQSQTAAWSRRIHEGSDTSSMPCVFEVAVMTDVPRLIRGLLLGRIRSAVPERFHPSFLIATENEPRWREIAGYAQPDAAYVVIVGVGREVIWRTSGELSEERVRELARQVTASAP